MKFEQYDIYKFNGLRINEQKEIVTIEMLAVILSPKEMNDVLNTVLLAPIYLDCIETPTTFKIDKEFYIKLEHISTIKKENVIEFVEKVDSSQIPKIKKVLNEIFFL